MMLVKINGVAQPTYDDLHRTVQENTAPIPEHISDVISSISWNQYDREGLNLFHDFDNVQAYCGNNILSWLDAFNYSVMDLNPVTKTTYNFIRSRAQVMRDGFNQEGENISEVFNNYQIQHHEYVMGLLEKIGDHTASLLDFISWFL